MMCPYTFPMTRPVSLQYAPMAWMRMTGKASVPVRHSYSGDPSRFAETLHLVMRQLDNDPKIRSRNIDFAVEVWLDARDPHTERLTIELHHPNRRRLLHRGA